jgi:RING finger protein 113A
VSELDTISFVLFYFLLVIELHYDNRCKHYFCEACALKHNAKSKKCYDCGAPTHGVFNSAKELKAKLALKKQRMEERAAEIRKKNESEGFHDIE